MVVVAITVMVASYKEIIGKAKEVHKVNDI